MKTTILSALIGAGCLLIANVEPAGAQPFQRTWVSGLGDDANDCSRAAPCRSFGGAQPKTTAGGQISCLDPIFNITATIINKSITIDCGGFPAAVPGITINGANIAVIIRNLTIGGNTVGTVGINFVNGLSLEVDNVNIEGFNSGAATGILFAPSAANSLLQVNNSNITTNGISPFTGGGIAVQPAAGGSAFVIVHNSKIENNSIGIAAASTAGPITMTVRDSTIANNRSFGIIAAGSNAVNLMIDRATVSNNLTTGVLANGANLVARFNNSVISGNPTGVASLNGAMLRSFKNNAIKGNGSDGTPIAQDNLD